MTQQAPICLALLGAGRWARAYARTIDGLPNVCLATVARTKNEPPDFLPAGCRFTTDWRAATLDHDIDGVIIATPPSLHAEMADFAMRIRKPVLVEKPLTLDVVQAEKLLETATSFQAVALVEHTHLFSPGFRGLKQHIARIGTLRAVHSAAGARGPFRREVPTLWDWGAHDVAMCLDVLKAAPARIEARRTQVETTPEGTGEAYQIDMEMPDGLPVRIEISNLLDNKLRRFTVYGQDGVLRFDDWCSDKLQLFPAAEPFSEPSNGKPLYVAPELPLSVAVGDFIKAIRNRDAAPDSLRLGVDVVRILDRCSRSLK